MSQTNNTKKDTSIDDDDIYTTTDDDMKDVKLSHSDDQSIPTSTFTDELFSSTKDEDEDMENGVRKLPSPPTRRRNRSFCCICQRVVTPLVLLSILILFLIYFFGNSNKLQRIPGAAVLFASEDLGEQYVWKGTTGEGGLTLNIINALDTQWYTYFDTAVSDWDNGTPDALTLTSEVASAPDPDCTTVEGVLKMCNNDYGATDWMGINEVLNYGNEIAGSTGMMNDHYFGTSAFGDSDKRQYTMCHEMGHGFGLPHTDTAMWNRNTGNCLDYTNRPKSNMRPGQINYERLVNVYGTVGSSNTTTANTSASAPSSSSNNGNTNTNAPQNSGNNGNNNDDNTNNNDDNQNNNQNNNNQNNNMQHQKNNNNGGRRRRGLSNNDVINPIPTFVHDRLRQLRKEYSNGYIHQQRKLLVRNNNVNSNNDHYVVDLGDGYSVEVTFLRA
jgi:hypothetical protein